MLCDNDDISPSDEQQDDTTPEEKSDVLDKYAHENLDMTADVSIDDDPKRKPDYESSPLGKRYCECHDQIEDVRRLAEDCMCHQCNNYCLQSKKTNTPKPHLNELKLNRMNQ